MNSESIKSDFLAARAKTAVTIMNATGWKQGLVNPECVSIDSVFFYVFDYQSKWIWCCSVPKGAFYAALQQVDKIDHSAVIACCNQMIGECSKTNGLNPEKENDLAFSLTAYISITKSYLLTERATKQNHFAVIRYGSTDTLRPFAMGGPARHLISTKEIHYAMQQVIARDSVNHPEFTGKS